MRVIASATLLAVAVAKPHFSKLPDYSFETFLGEFGKNYTDTTEFELRKTLFETRKASFIAHNSQIPAPSYTLNVNKLADLSAAEIKQFKGYNKAMGRSFRGSSQAKAAPRSSGPLPKSMDWRDKNAVTPVKDQGGCGSCWAFGSAETLESHTYIHGGKGVLPVLSEQQIVDCAPNPDHCGGDGGCRGSIPELAYAWVKDNGLASEADYSYTGFDGMCSTSATPAASVTGFVNVPSNNYTAVLEALATQGPLAITVSAGPWEFYDSGVFSRCGTDADSTDLDHVVQLVGYGTEGGTDYWTIRNSWGRGFGEEGYVRIQRHSDEDWCATDNKPADGTGCSGGPSSVQVCGSCGILYDAVYPTV